jgi:hypothetical protein
MQTSSPRQFWDLVKVEFEKKSRQQKIFKWNFCNSFAGCTLHNHKTNKEIEDEPNIRNLHEITVACRCKRTLHFIWINGKLLLINIWIHSDLQKKRRNERKNGETNSHEDGKSLDYGS